MGRICSARNCDLFKMRRSASLMRAGGWVTTRGYAHTSYSTEHKLFARPQQLPCNCLRNCDPCHTFTDFRLGLRAALQSQSPESASPGRLKCYRPRRNCGEPQNSLLHSASGIGHHFVEARSAGLNGWAPVLTRISGPLTEFVSGIGIRYPSISPLSFALSSIR